MRHGQVEIRNGRTLHGVMLQEGRAASRRREIFTPGSVEWPDDGVAILTRHRGAPEIRAIPVREPDGRIRIEAPATDPIREAVAAGRTSMSVEFKSLRENRTAGGIREVLRALVPRVALVADPEYTMTSAELRQRGGFGSRVRTGRKMDCRCSARKTGSAAKNVEFAHTAFEDLPDEVAAVVRGLDTTIARTADDSLRLSRARDGSLAVKIDPLDTADGRKLRELVDAGVPVHARPLWDPDASTWTLEGDTALVTAARFSLLLVRPVAPDRAQGLEPLARTAEDRNGRGLAPLERSSAVEAILELPETRRVFVWL